MKKRLYLLLPVFGAALVMVFVVGFMGRQMAQSAPPSIPEKLLYCGTCHSMEKETETWQKSPHSGVACLQCHEESDSAWVKHELDASGNVMADKTQAKSIHTLPLKAPDARCEECHADQMDSIMKDVVPTPIAGAKAKGTPGKPMTVKAAHAVHTEKVGLSCAECHTDSAHGTVLTGTALRDKAHEQCMTCHVEKQVKIAVIDSTSCGACHTDVASVTPADHKNTATWTKTHGQNVKTGACGACHLDESAGTHSQIAQPANFPSASKDTCVACHSGVQMPHPVSFISTHGQVAMKAPTGTCESCHSAGSQASAASGGAQSCTSCHASTMPHPDNFLAQHGAAANANPASCTTCHSSSNKANPTAYHASSRFCTDCHGGTTMPHPANFLSKHGDLANANPASCTNCHSPRNAVSPNADYASPSYCMDCHLTPMPHPASFLSSHGADARKSPATCDACHSSKNVAKPTAPHANAGYCAGCHDSYEHESGWVGSHATAVDESCATCHTLQGQPGQHNACSTCHNADGQWHPNMWFVSHAREVEKTGEEACATCHDVVQPSCSKCHRDR